MSTDALPLSRCLAYAAEYRDCGTTGQRKCDSQVWRNSTSLSIEKIPGTCFAVNTQPEVISNTPSMCMKAHKRSSLPPCSHSPELMRVCCLRATAPQSARCLGRLPQRINLTYAAITTPNSFCTVIELPTSECIVVPSKWDRYSTVDSYRHHIPECGPHPPTATPDTSENEDNMGGRSTNPYTGGDNAAPTVRIRCQRANAAVQTTVQLRAQYHHSACVTAQFENHPPSQHGMATGGAPEPMLACSEQIISRTYCKGDVQQNTGHRHVFPWCAFTSPRPLKQ